MSSNPRPSPLVVCGFARSGTQMCATILHNSRDVELQGEIPPLLAQPLLQWLKTVKDAQGADHPDRFHRLCRTTLRDIAAPAAAIRRRDARWFGHKTPRHEFHFRTYEELFDHPAARVRYVYCLRNPYDVWRSYRAMPWNGLPSVYRFLRGWTRSVQAFELMKSSAPDRVSLFNLDAMLAAPDRSEWVGKAIFEPLMIGSESLVSPVETLKNVNSAKAKFDLELPELPARERSVIAGSRKVKRIMNAYFPDVPKPP